ncbi:hypothetical protein RhiirA1_448643 [Rhizophagus irregularis]|uniref:Uncharacterized protein n=1 Tax=Rhizophagus irregularis TaxID=588596 RepID=A0A2N0SJ52_9GLOM|nr:hypothetical protein RhiirA1_448643 [Rhizophagus irregularis]
MAAIHYNDESARNPANNAKLNDVILRCGFYQYMDIYSYLPIDIMKRYRYLKNLQLTCPIGIYRYAQENYLDETEKVRMLAEIHEELPKYFTQQMRKNYSLIKTVTPAVLQMLYFDLTGDAATTSNAISCEVEERLRLMLALEDPSIIFDLRETPAVDNRWHNTIMHMSLAISIHDLHNIILARLHIKHSEPLPAAIHIPSYEWIYVDANYYAALFHYLREFLIQYRQYVCFILADDKHKVPIGKGMPISTEIHNRQSLAAQNSTLDVADHDFTNLSLTPSVIFFVSIPKDISDGFYNREVFVSFKDTVFEPSSAIRHTTEFYNVINTKYTHHTSPPILCLYTDRRPDHRCTYGSVQIALISLFLSRDYDMLIAV